MQSGKHAAVRAVRPKRPIRNISDMVLGLSKRLMEGMEQREIIQELWDFAELCEYLGAIDELDRISGNTLDADVDVWSADDDGNMLLLSKRRAELQAKTDRILEVP